MRARAAVLLEQPGPWHVIDVELDEPHAGEVLVEMVATGICHSDDHAAVGDHRVAVLPWCAGHEGAGIVRQVGPGVVGLAEGDHVVTSFIPACGRCTWCASGQGYLCDHGRYISAGPQVDGTFRMRTTDGRDVGTSSMLGTFATWQVFDQTSVIKIRDDVPLGVACLVACGVPTGWGSATVSAQITPGDTVIVMGIGGVGINAVQGARFVGAGHVVAVDPVEWKRQRALELGATAAFATIAEAAAHARSVTDGQGAHAAIIAVGVITGTHVSEALASVSKAGIVVVTAVGNARTTTMDVNLLQLSMFAKRIQGVLYGQESPRVQVPRLLDLYVEGRLELDGLATTRYRLDDINQAFADMHAGVNLRGVIDF